MHWLRMIFVVTVASLTALPDHAIAESLRERLVGTWLLVSNTNTGPDGTNRQPFGESPTGSTGNGLQPASRDDQPPLEGVIRDGALLRTGRSRAASRPSHDRLRERWPR